jgi:cytochrome c-type biogenesis protein CcmH/NrfF
MKKLAYLLWPDPFALLLITLVVLISLIRKRTSSNAHPPTDEKKLVRCSTGMLWAKRRLF